MFSSPESKSGADVAKRSCEQLLLKLKFVGFASMERNLVSDVILMAPLLGLNELLELSDSLAAYLVANQNEEMNEMIALVLEDRCVACLFYTMLFTAHVNNASHN